MKITTDKIENFEQMTDAEKVKALLELEFDVPKDTSTIDKYKQLINDANAEASKYKKALREKESEAETKAREQAEQAERLQSRLAELEREKSVSEHLANFVSVGYTADLAKTSAEAIADGNLSVVFDNLKAFITNRENEIKADVLKGTPRPSGGGTGKEHTVTKEEFAKMGLAEMQKLFNENPELYNELSK